MQDRPIFGALNNQGLCHLRSVTNKPKIFLKLHLEKIRLFGL